MPISAMNLPAFHVISICIFFINYLLHNNVHIFEVRNTFSTISALIGKFWWISLYVNDDAILQSSICDVKFSNSVTPHSF